MVRSGYRSVSCHLFALVCSNRRLLASLSTPTARRVPSVFRLSSSLTMRGLRNRTAQCAFAHGPVPHTETVSSSNRGRTLVNLRTPRDCMDDEIVNTGTSYSSQGGGLCPGNFPGLSWNFQVKEAPLRERSTRPTHVIRLRTSPAASNLSFLRCAVADRSVSDHHSSCLMTML